MQILMQQQHGSYQMQEGYFASSPPQSFYGMPGPRSPHTVQEQPQPTQIPNNGDSNFANDAIIASASSEEKASPSTEESSTV